MQVTKNADKSSFIWNEGLWDMHLLSKKNYIGENCHEWESFVMFVQEFYLFFWFMLAGLALRIFSGIRQQIFSEWWMLWITKKDYQLDK